MRGFVSLLFIALLGESLLLVSALEQVPRPQENGESERLALERIALENGIDRIIEHELQTGLVLRRTSGEIKENINRRILNFVNEWREREGRGIQYDAGFATLTQTNYLSLLTQPIHPFTETEMRVRTHVLVLPVDETSWYGEYTYTGGPSGTGIFMIKLRAGAFQTLFAIPSGHRTCATNLAIVPCVVAGATNE